jgi:hypothetical protein
MTKCQKNTSTFTFSAAAEIYPQTSPGQHQDMYDIIFTFICLFARYILSLHNNALNFYTK